MVSKRNTYREKINETEGLNKAMRFCAYQERCIQDLFLAFKKWNVDEKYHDSIIDILIEDNFINEERFSKLFASGKFRNNNWGKVKIVSELKQKNINSTLIQQAVDKIEEDEYIRTANKLIKRKLIEYGEMPSVNLRNKILWYMVGKGFERELVLGLFKKINELKF